jgi:hypothetical protein
MTNVAEFNNRKIVSAENAKLEDLEDAEDATKPKLSEDEQRLFGAWLKLTLEANVKEVKVRSVNTTSHGEWSVEVTQSVDACSSRRVSRSHRPLSRNTSRRRSASTFLLKATD